MKLTIYGRKNCAWCEKAKTLAESLKQEDEIEDFIYIDYQEENLSKEDLFFIAGTQVKTVPIILVDTKYIGGYQELSEYF